MPCFITGTAEGDARLSASEARAEATALARMLCAWCAHPETMPEEVRAWWARHGQVDAERKARDLAAKLARIERLRREHVEALRELEAEDP